jgi:hypothetical protein
MAHAVVALLVEPCIAYTCLGQGLRVARCRSSQPTFRASLSSAHQFLAATEVMSGVSQSVSLGSNVQDASMKVTINYVNGLNEAL